MASSVICLLFILTAAHQGMAQTLSYNITYNSNQLCPGMYIKSLESLQRLKNCVMIHGSLHIILIERSKIHDFQNISFPMLREITGFMLVYRTQGLESLGHLFPNLARIRGEEVFDDYALIVHDMQNLAEVGLYNLLKIDRGGVIIWGGPLTCYVETIDWETIAPKARHVLKPIGKQSTCNMPCTCTTRSDTNHCWNNKKCQRYLSGPDGETCNEQCLGCRNVNPDECSVCRHFTYQRRCVSSCPAGTIILQANQYCITSEECHGLGGWSWKNECVFQCPLGYQETKESESPTCKPCPNCSVTCPSLRITNLKGIKDAERCVFINGSLTINVRSVPDATQELRTYLGRIKEVEDFILIYGSMTIISLDFLSSLKIIRGRELKNGKYSLVIHNMLSLQTLFTPTVSKMLKIEKGALRIFQNPVLCYSEINKIKQLFPIEPSEIDIPEGMNGYSGSCKDVALNIKTMVNGTTAIITFSPVGDPSSLNYSVLYGRVPPNSISPIVPESCSESEWFVAGSPNIVEESTERFGIQLLHSLRSASTYAVCVEYESNDPKNRVIARSPVKIFTTPVGKPAPPFITELVAYSSDAIIIRWVNHKDYSMHITHYELDVSLVVLNPEDVKYRDHCQKTKYLEENDMDLDSMHAVVMRPPKEYQKYCESICGVLSSMPKGAMVDEDFDVCGNRDECDSEDAEEVVNSTMGKYVKTLSLKIKGLNESYQVGGLAPYREYRFRLRACTDKECSKTARQEVRTFKSKDADKVVITSVTVNTNGELSVFWDPPVLVNGLVLAYIVEVSPLRPYNENAYSIPQSWCVLSNITNLDMRSEKTSKYQVRICTVSLASTLCGDWVSVEPYKIVIPTWWWWGILTGVLLCLVPFIWTKNWISRRNEHILLLDSTSWHRNESMPPGANLVEFEPIHFRGSD